MGERTRVNFNYHPSFSLNALDTLDIAEGKRVGGGGKREHSRAKVAQSGSGGRGTEIESSFEAN